MMKQTLEAFDWIEAEAHNARETDDAKRLKNISQRLDKLQKLVVESEQHLKAKA